MDGTDGEHDKSQDERTVVTADVSPGTVRVGGTIGPYTLLRILGEGGFGIIYLAEQRSPIKRRVALKIIKPGMDSEQVIRRFESERQALALLDHPNIAHVYDAGTTELGQPYFVMEYVKGIPITEHCDRYKLTIEDRLKLFLPVCEAIQHAHQKGIIHRDIKSSNVQVCTQGERVIPKIIDFGVVKALTQPLTERALVTEQGQMVGTPEYMSPEQADMTNQDIDTRTDIYSLGVLLYKLLTGTLPFASEALRTGGTDQLRQIIRHESPNALSTQVSRLGSDKLSELGRCCRADAAAIRRKLRGDLDWIAFKAMEKDRTRRYQTAHALAEDIQRHLNHEPVVAGPPSKIYRLNKFLLKHREQLIRTAIMAIVLSAVVAVSLMYVRAVNRGQEAEALKHRDILSKALESRSNGQFQDALTRVETMVESKHVGPEARLLHARLILELQGPADAVRELNTLLNERDEIACQAHFLLARIYIENNPDQSETTKEYWQIAKEHQRRGEKLFSESAEAFYLRAMTAGTVQEMHGLLNKAISLDRSHYASLKARALTHYALVDYRDMERDAVAMTTLRDWDPLGYFLMAIALRETRDFADAVQYHNMAIKISAEDPELYDQRRQTYMQMGNHAKVLSDAQKCVLLRPNENIYHFNVFCALVALGLREEAQNKYSEIFETNAEARKQFHDWSMRYVFSCLDAGLSWHPQASNLNGAAFAAMREASDYYQELNAKAKRIVPQGFRATWSPDGSKLAYSRGFPGANGIEVLHLGSGRTQLLTIPGKDPAWSPDGSHIAFVRERQIQALTDITIEGGTKPYEFLQEEVWIIKPNGEGLRRVAKGGLPSWGRNSKKIYFHSRQDKALCSISVDGLNAQPTKIISCSSWFPVVSPDEKYFAYAVRSELRIVDLSSGSLVTSWSAPPGEKGMLLSWSRDGRALSVGGYDKSQLGLWIYEIDTQKASKIASGPVTMAAWSPDGSQMAFDLRSPYFEIWITDLESYVPTAGVRSPRAPAARF
ncbi:MAG: protein kinase [Phycisphaerales bacterium]|nr:MAG: protein kinase [Phycisphaerales bacterium]